MKFIRSQRPSTIESKIYPLFWAPQGYSVNAHRFRLPDTATKVWYENRDRGHATAGGFENTIETQPGMTDYGPNLNQFYDNGIVLSNSSTAQPATENGGSNTRVADNGWAFWYTMRDAWQSGVLQFLPEHQDYDGTDWFKINQPYVTTTQGSSGSELEELERCRRIVEALRPEVRQWLIDNKRVGDVVAYLMRSNQHNGYLDPLSHRVVTDLRRGVNQADIDLAASITLDSIPPTLQIRVISDSHDIRNPDGTPATSTIRTPELAGFQRVDATPLRTIVVELSANKPCEFEWIKSQGECTIIYQNPEKSRVTITIPFQTDLSVAKPDGSVIVSNRVEVVAVAFDGTHYSCPVFVTEYFTPEARALRPRMNEIVIHADNSFRLRVNGNQIATGDNWQFRYTTPFSQWQATNTIEVEVANLGGPGGLLGAVFVGNELHVTDSSWQASLDRVNWVTPSVLQNAGSVWAAAGLPAIPASWTAKGIVWLWHPQATETSTVWFRKTIGAVTPDPQPEPAPQPSVIAECIADLEAVLSKLRGIA